MHILLADGYIDEANVFHRLKFISYTALRKRWMTTLLYALRDHIDDKYKYLLKRITNILYKNTIMVFTFMLLLQNTKMLMMLLIML